MLPPDIAFCHQVLIALGTSVLPSQPARGMLYLMALTIYDMHLHMNTQAQAHTHTLSYTHNYFLVFHWYKESHMQFVERVAELASMPENIMSIST